MNNMKVQVAILFIGNFILILLSLSKVYSYHNNRKYSLSLIMIL